MTSPDNEIDLLELATKAVATVKKNIFLILGAFVVGILLSMTNYLLSPKVYESKMLISSDILTESYSRSLIEELNKLIKEDNAQTVSGKIGLSVEDAMALSSIEIKSAAKEKPNETSENIYINVVAKIKGNVIWPQLQNGIVNYLENNDFVKIRVEQKKRYINKVIEKIDLELTDLEKLKARISDGALIQSNKQNLVLFDPTTVNSKILELNKEKLTLQNGIEIVNSVQVVEGFTVFNNPVSPKASVTLIIGLTFGLFLIGLLFAFKAIRKIWSLS